MKNKTGQLVLPLVLLMLSAVASHTLADTPFHHGPWNQLLASHVLSRQGGQVTVVDYQGMQKDHAQLKAYLDRMAEVRPSQFDQWPKHDQLAFLINAYNAWTVELILSAWPDVDSIRDLGSFFSSPWSREFVVLLGKTRTLDDIEHGLIRGSGRYQDPRIHFAVNCASIGCPALRPEAYVGNRLDQQLDEQVRLFLSDRNRNRVDGNVIRLSSIFKWYREDFEKGWRGYHRLEDFLLAHADALELNDTLKTQLRLGTADIEFLDYDWRLNKP